MTIDWRRLFKFAAAPVLCSIALLLAPVKGQASLVTFGFEGHVGSCFGFPEDCAGVAPGPVHGLFTFDTDGVDLNPHPQFGQYAFSGSGAGLSVTLANNLTLFSDSLTIFVVNDQLGAFCGAGHRDTIFIFSDPLLRATFEDCS